MVSPVHQVSLDPAVSQVFQEVLGSLVPQGLQELSQDHLDQRDLRDHKDLLVQQVQMAIKVHKEVEVHRVLQVLQGMSDQLGLQVQMDNQAPLVQRVIQDPPDFPGPLVGQVRLEHPEQAFPGPKDPLDHKDSPVNPELQGLQELQVLTGVPVLRDSPELLALPVHQGLQVLRVLKDL